MGLSAQAALDSAALYGDMAVGMGISEDKAKDMSMKLTQLSADLASYKNISNDMSKTALKGVFTGETESLKNLGIVMTQAQLSEYALSKGIKKKIKDMKEAELVQLRYNYVLSKTINAQGDFERTGGGFANQSRKFGEIIKEAQTKIGFALLPKIEEGLKNINSLITDNMDTIVGVITPAISMCGEAIGFLAGNLDIIIPAVGALGVAFGTLNIISTVTGFIAAFCNPIGLAVLAIGGLIAAFGVAKAKGITFLMAIKEIFKTITKGIGIVFKLTAAIGKLFTLGGIVNSNTNLGLKKKDDIKHHALGTNFSTGGLAVVGEYGPELVNLKKGASVTPAAKTKQILQGRDINVKVEIQGNVIGNFEFIQQIKNVLALELKTALAVV